MDPMMQPDDEQMEQGNEEPSIESLEAKYQELDARVAALEGAKKPSMTAGQIVGSKAKGFFGS